MSNTEKKLNITFLLPGKGVGGGSRAIVEFGNNLLGRGHNVRIFYRKEPILFRELTRLVYLRTRYGNHDWLSNFYGKVESYNHLNPDQFKHDEIILSMCTQTTIDAHELPEEHGIKVLHCHGAELENWDQMVQSWRLPKYVLVVSSHLIDIFKNEVNKDIIGIVPDGVDCNSYFPAFDEKNRNGIGATFRWGYTKGPEMVLEVLEKVNEKYPTTPKLSFGNGRKPDGFESVNYSRLPSVKHAREIYSKSMIWLLTSRLEGFGMSVLEAMACGCVVISTDCGGPSDVIKDGVNGYLVPVDDSNAMMERIAALINNKDLRSKLAKAAIETAHRFTWDNASNKLEAYLFSIYNSHMGIDNRNI